MRQVTIPTDSHVAILVSCQGVGLMAIASHGKVVERWGCMAARGLVDLRLGKSFYVNIRNMKAKRFNLPELMIVAYASSAPTCIIHARDEEQHM